MNIITTPHPCPHIKLRRIYLNHFSKKLLSWYLFNPINVGILINNLGLGGGMSSGSGTPEKNPEFCVIPQFFCLYILSS